MIVSLAALVAFLLPIAYENVSATFGAVACVGIVLAMLTTVVIHLALNSVREHRRRLKFLIDATATFDTSLDPAEALRNLARAAVPELAELCVIDLLDRDGHDRARPSPPASTRRSRAESNACAQQVPLDLAGVHPVAEVLRTGEPRVVADLTDQAALARLADSARAPAVHARRRLPLGGGLPDGRARAHARRDLLPARRQRRALRARRARRARRPHRPRGDGLRQRAAVRRAHARRADAAAQPDALRRCPRSPGWSSRASFARSAPAAKSAATSTTPSATSTAAGWSSATSAARAPRRPR